MDEIYPEFSTYKFINFNRGFSFKAETMEEFVIIEHVLI